MTMMTQMLGQMMWLPASLLARWMDLLAAMMRVVQLRESLVRYTALMGELTKRLKGGAGHGCAGRRRAVTGRPPFEGEPGAAVLMAFFVLTLLAIVLLIRQLAAMAWNWAEPTRGVLLTALGGLFLRALSRGSWPG